MRAEIISIGSELTTGRNLDTNSQWLSRRLAEMGVPVHWHTTIADDLDANLEAFRIAVRRAGLVLCSGGLGPTQDDLTRQVLAKVAGVELLFDQESFDRIAEMFRRRGRTMPANASSPSSSGWIMNVSSTSRARPPWEPNSNG